MADTEKQNAGETPLDDQGTFHPQSFFTRFRVAKESLLQLLSDEFHHFGLMLLSALEEGELVERTNEVVLSILRFEVSVTVQIVSIEAHHLHVGEELGSIRQVLNLDGSEEGTSRLEVTLGE